MSVKSKVTGAALAIAAAGLFGCASTTTMETSAVSENIHCYGVNKCKGQNDCKTASNECKGHGSCKGQGFVSMSEKACDQLGGKVGA
ncbi:MAG: hypothetical protein OEZ68_06505 [Gammaproteobacteria bacterium]|nr:hypothetical protein [Gammaproteobacteria bacterium]MDH5800441.1 hypothetical protein [Gammaproteobacteria bacterium]